MAQLNKGGCGNDVIDHPTQRAFAAWVKLADQDSSGILQTYDPNAVLAVEPTRQCGGSSWRLLPTFGSLAVAHAASLARRCRALAGFWNVFAQAVANARAHLECLKAQGVEAID
jgi:hypothetical protein